MKMFKEIEGANVSGAICKGGGWAYVFGWFSGCISLNFPRWEGEYWWAVTVTRNKASKAWNDKRYTDTHITDERFERLAILGSD